MFKIRLGSAVWYSTTFMFFGFLLLPLFILVAVSFNPVSMVFPPKGFTLHWYSVILDKPEFLLAAYASAKIGVITALISTTFGVMAALGIHRQVGRSRVIIQNILLSPLFFPAVIVALATFQLMMSIGLMTNVAALIAAHVVVTMPYPIRNVIAHLTGFDKRLEEAAMTVGADPWQTLFRVTLPMLKASIVPSLIITFIMSWNNYTISVFLANADWTTLPLQLRAYLQYEYEPFVAAMSTILLILSGAMLYVSDRVFGGAGKQH